MFLCQLFLATRFRGIFLYARGSKFHGISAKILFHSRLLASSRSSKKKLLIPLKKLVSCAKPILSRICWYILQFFDFDFSTRVFFFFFFSSMVSKLPFCFSNSIESFASKTIHESLVSLPFPRLQLDDVQQEVTNLLLDVKGREVCSSPSSVITIQSKNKILVALSSSFTPLSCVMIHSRVMIINFFLLLKVATQFTA